MTNEEYIKASEAFFIRYSEHRAELALAEGKAEPETKSQQYQLKGGVIYGW